MARVEIFFSSLSARSFEQKLEVSQFNAFHFSSYRLSSFYYKTTDFFKWKALHMASYRGYVEIMNILLQNGADIDAPGLNQVRLC